MCVRPRGCLNVSSFLLVFFQSFLSAEVLNDLLLMLNKVESGVCVCVGVFDPS